MNHYVYQITNNTNGMIYIGKRSCKCDIDKDNYLGSGTRLKYAIKKYGKENFSKNIIDICDSAEMAFELEELIVDKSFIDSKATYNIIGGGYGASCMSEISKEKISKNHAKHWLGKTGPMNGKKHSLSAKHAISLANKNHCSPKGEMSPSFGLKRSNETKLKMSMAQLTRHNCEENVRIIDNLINEIKHSNIDFKSFGWVNKTAIIIGITPQKVSKWMKRNMPDFYQSECFKRNSK